MPTKDEMQPLLDEMVERHRKKNMVTVFWGVNVEELTREELLAALQEVIEERDKTQKKLVYHLK